MTPFNPEQLFREMDDLKDSIKTLQTSMDTGFTGVHARLDTANGRTRKLETKMAVVFALGGLVWAILLPILPLAFEAVLEAFK